MPVSSSPPTSAPVTIPNCSPSRRRCCAPAQRIGRLTEELPTCRAAVFGGADDGIGARDPHLGKATVVHAVHAVRRVPGSPATSPHIRRVRARPVSVVRGVALPRRLAGAKAFRVLRGWMAVRNISYWGVSSVTTLGIR